MEAREFKARGPIPLDFGGDPSSDDIPIVVDRVALKIAFAIEGRRTTWSFAGYPTRQLTNDFFEVIVLMLKKGRYRAYSTFDRDRKYYGGLLHLLGSQPDSREVSALRDVTSQVLEDFDGRKLSLAAWCRLGTLIRLLRFAADHCPERVAPEFLGESARRLKFISRHPKPKSTPRNPYSDYVGSQIEAAARIECDEAIRNIAEGARAFVANRRAGMPHRLLFTMGDRSVLKRLKQIEPADAQLPALAARRLIQLRGQFRLLEEAQQDQIVDDLIAGASGVGVERAYSLAEGSISAWASDPDFQASLYRRYGIVRAATRVRIEHRHTQQARLRQSCVKLMKAQRKRGSESRIDYQLRMRTLLFEHWASSGVPHVFLERTSLSVEAICRWSEPELCLEPIEWENHDLSTVRVARGKLVASTELQHATATFQQIFRRVRLLERMLEEEPISPLLPMTMKQLFRLQLPSEEIRPFSAVQIHRSYYKPLLEELLLAANGRVGFLPRDVKGGLRATGDKTPSVVRQIFASQAELLPFLTRIGLTCEIDYGSLKLLRRDCLQNASDGWVDVFFRKKRKGSELLHKRVLDGGPHTPGGIIRQVLALTEPASLVLVKAGHRDANSLWIGRFNQRLAACSFSCRPLREPWTLFASRHELLDDDGNRLQRVHPARFRKTVKANRYTKSGGQLRSIVDDHSQAVARDRYADVHALAELHDDAVTRGLNRAAAEAKHRVIPQEPIPPDAAEKLHRATGKPLERCVAVLGGTEDTWVGSCLDFENSPFDRPGRPCPKAFTECVLCENSVFTRRKLPNLIVFHAWLAQRAAGDSESAAMIQVIERDIFAQFPPEEVEAAARATSELYIPHELKAGAW